jgi:beta-glucanase (GH16 family)
MTEVKKKITDSRRRKGETRMNKWYVFIICCIIMVVSLAFTGQQSAYGGGLRKLDASSGGYKLVWSDEFNEYYKPDSRNARERREYAEYTSASLTTRGLHKWMYGRFEMRGRIDTRSGLWPAFWTLGSEGRWPSCGEIDIMEYYRGMLLANAAWGTEKRWVAKWDDVRKPISDFNDPGWSGKFHLWRMDWDANNIKLYEYD